MKHETQQTETQAPTKETPARKRKRKKPRKELQGELAEEIVRLHGIGFSARKTAKTTGLGRKVVRRVLVERGLVENPPPPPRREKNSKLDPYKERVKEKMARHLTITRILREIAQEGYTGGRTILADYVRENSAAPPPRKKVWRRFETAPVRRPNSIGPLTASAWAARSGRARSGRCMLSALSSDFAERCISAST
jgi:hypothetical protein